MQIKGQKFTYEVRVWSNKKDQQDKYDVTCTDNSNQKVYASPETFTTEEEAQDAMNTYFKVLESTASLDLTEHKFIKEN